MQINSKDTIAGHSIIAIRKLFKGRDLIHADYISYKLSITKPEAIRLIHELERLDYLEKESSKDLWKTTIKGNALSSASAGKPILRKTADRLLTKFTERITTVNNDSYYLYEVERAVVFGSYLSNNPKIGDIDIAISLIAKEKDNEIRVKKDRDRYILAQERGKHFSNFIETLGYAEIEVQKYLKAKSPYIQMVGLEQHADLLKNIETITIFPHDIS